jgi:tetratricopeptide (TPR) repeat protein
LHPQASASIVTRAHYFINDELRQIKYTPAVVSKFDSRPGNLFNLGLIFSRLYHYDFSEKFYNLGLAQNPYRYDIYARVAHVMGDDRPVLKALYMFPENTMMLEEAGDYYVDKVDQHSREKAVILYRRGAELKPTHKDLSRKLARALRKLKRYEEAISVLQNWINQNGGNNLITTIYRGDIARIYLDMSNSDMALKILEKEMDSYQAGTMMTIAAAYKMRNEINKAESMYRKALDRYPQVDHVLSGIAAFYWDQERDAEASDLIAMGRRINGDYSRWYFSDFSKVFIQARQERISEAINSLKATGASSWEISSLAHLFAARGRYEIALMILKQISVKKTMARLELNVSIYEVEREWKGEDAARNSLTKAVPQQMYGHLAMVLFKRGHFGLLMKFIENPESFQTQWREFLWLLKLMAWIAENEQPANLKNMFYAHYQNTSKDYYHSIGRFMLGNISQSDIIALIKTSKQRCEFSYYIGFAERVQGNFNEAAIWYQICRETLLSNNGEFHWASDELFWWAHMGTKNRHRLVRDDIRSYRQKNASTSSI